MACCCWVPGPPHGLACRTPRRTYWSYRLECTFHRSGRCNCGYRLGRLHPPQPRRHRQNYCPSRHELLLRRHPTARHCRRHPNARARRNFRPAAHHSAPMAHVLRTLHCDRLFLPGSAASFPGLPARLYIPDHTSTSAAAPTDLLVPPRAVQQGLQEHVVAEPATCDPLNT